MFRDVNNILQYNQALNRMNDDRFQNQYQEANRRNEQARYASEREAEARRKREFETQQELNEIAAGIRIPREFDYSREAQVSDRQSRISEINRAKARKHKLKLEIAEAVELGRDVAPWVHEEIEMLDGMIQYEGRASQDSTRADHDNFSNWAQGIHRNIGLIRRPYELREEIKQKKEKEEAEQRRREEELAKEKSERERQEQIRRSEEDDRRIEAERKANDDFFRNFDGVDADALDQEVPFSPEEDKLREEAIALRERQRRLDSQNRQIQLGQQNSALGNNLVDRRAQALRNAQREESRNLDRQAQAANPAGPRSVRDYMASRGNRGEEGVGRDIPRNDYRQNRQIPEDYQRQRAAQQADIERIANRQMGFDLQGQNLENITNRASNLASRAPASIEEVLQRNPYQPIVGEQRPQFSMPPQAPAPSSAERDTKIQHESIDPGRAAVDRIIREEALRNYGEPLRTLPPEAVVAPENDLHRLSRQAIIGGVSAHTPYLDRANNYLEMAQQPSYHNLDNYLNPHQDHITNRLTRDAKRNFEKSILPALENQFVRLGQHGSSRHANLVREAAQESQQMLQDKLAEEYAKNYNNAFNRRETDAARQLEAARLSGQLGQTAQAQSFSGGAALEDVANAQRQNVQNIMNARNSNFDREQNYPINQLNRLSGWINNQAVPSSTQTTLLPNSNLVPRTKDYLHALVPTLAGGLQSMIGGMIGNRPPGKRNGGYVSYNYPRLRE